MITTYTKNELQQELVEKLNVTGVQAQTIVDQFLNCLTGAFQRGDKVTFRNFGVFSVRLRQAKTGRNPKQPDVAVHIPAKVIVRFKAGKELDALLNPQA